MPNEAQKVFSRLISNSSSSSIGDIASLYSAKILYGQGSYPAAEKLLSTIEDLPGKLRIQQDLLLINLLIAKKQFQQAGTRLPRLDSDTKPGYFSRHNLAVNMLKDGISLQGAGLLDGISKEIFSDAELKMLQDKANLALGYHYLQKKEPALAKVYFQKIRLNSYFSPKALLGSGFAESAQNQHKRALIPWMELAQREIRDVETQEALLTVPDTLFKLESYKEAQKHYQNAISHYAAEALRVKQSIDAIRAGKLENNVLRLDAGDDTQWQNTLRKLPDAPENHYFPWLMENSQIQEAVLLYRKSLALQNILEQQRARRTSAANTHIDQALVEAQGLMKKLDAYIQKTMISELSLREQRLDNYLTQAKLGMAELYNHAAARGDE
ncbi:MAG: tetratricopeptide repeat protein [Gammaproteobacteria bacterium]